MAIETQGLRVENKTAYICLYAPNFQQVMVGIFEKDKEEPVQIIPMRQENGLWKIETKASSTLYYAFKTSKDSPWLADPFAKALNTSHSWGKKAATPFLSPLEMPPAFDWEGVKSPGLSKENLIIYEMHVRGFTIHSSSKVANPGTFEGIVEKIPYLKSLGINCIELMPIYEFDEIKENSLINYWGYDPISFFSPKRSFGKDTTPFGAVQSFKNMVKALHQNGIELILDVVYNHTGEKDSHLFSLRGLAKSTYYLIHEDGTDYNFSGCGNTVSTNHPQTMHLILESLRYFATEMGVDGFRFDLASILTRGANGEILSAPPILKAIQNDPILSKKKLIAESWDAAGLYQVGLFPTFGPWSEWNGRYRDIVRNFIKGTDDRAGRFSSVLCGSDFLYGYTQTPLSSVNFITSHDGFSLYDLVSYNQKHNEKNQEHNNDGSNDNKSWNCGEEGPSNQPEVNHLRERQVRNFFSALLISQGIPMILMGDEYGHSRMGNNNPYVQDNEINWFLWDQMENRKEWVQFVRSLICLKTEHPEFKKTHFLSDQDIIWHGHKPKKADWSASSRFIAFEIGSFYVAFNAYSHAFEFELPSGNWSCLIDTSMGWKQQKIPLPPLFALPSYSSLIAEKRIAR